MSSSTESQNSTTCSFLEDVLTGLSLPEKRLDCKYFYDERGSQLFERICSLEEYYPTRAEISITEQYAEEIAHEIGVGARLVEFGSGSSVKTRCLLDHLRDPAGYVPLDVSEDHLLATADELRIDYPGLEIRPVVADFTQTYALPQLKREPKHTTVYFPGSTIGNFSPEAAGELLDHISQVVGHDGGLLIGIDLVKDTEVIEAAYNDAKGVTAEFTLNLLHRANDELGANFDLDRFRHKAVYNEEAARIETFIVSEADQEVTIADQVFQFGKGEHVISEYSHKYTIDGFCRFAADYRFQLDKAWTDDEQLFAVLFLVVD